LNEDVRQLEEKIAYLERHVAAQDRAMLELAEDIARLRRELLSLRARSATSDPCQAGEESEDDRPPHY
jgi:SlyX protein